MNKLILAFISASAIFSNCNSGAQQNIQAVKGDDSLAAIHNQNIFRQKIDSIIRPYKATVGIAIMGLEDRDTLTVNNHHKFPMQSVYKFQLAMAMLAEVDKGKFSLTQKIKIDRKDLHEETWSPMRDKYPKGKVELTLAELIDYSVAKSDNNACDILFKLMNGPLAVDSFIRGLSIGDMAIVATEQQMHTDDWNVQYTNYTTPSAICNLLDKFYNGQLLSIASHKFLMKTMTESSNSANRIKGLLPEATPVAHKTGTSNTNDKGMTAATNDVGIVTLPNGQHFAIAVLVSDTYEMMETNEKIIALVSKATYDYFMSKGQ